MAQPTAREQEMLELLNRFRLNPAQELSLLLNSSDPDVNSALTYFNVNRTELANQWSTLVAAQPLAWSSAINVAASLHNNAMITYGRQSHQLPGELGLGDRLTAAGYTGWTTAGENVYAFATSVFHAHAGFAIDWGNTSTGIQTPAGHRLNMINNGFREVGISINNSLTSVGPLVVTQDFGNRQALNNKGYILGVAYRDFDRDNFYDAGEGLRDVLINVTRLNGTSFFSQNLGTMDAGGYQTLLDPGRYLVRFFRNGSLVNSQTTTINATNASNVKVDLKIDVAPAPTSGKGKIVGTLFNDLNGNGVWDKWEPVQSGWRVFLDSNSNKILDTGEVSVTTDVNGEYNFNNLAPGTYQIAEVLPQGWRQTLPNPGNPVGQESYKLDDGSLNGGIAYTTGDTMIFNAFTAKSANEIINSITVGLSSYGNGNGNPKAVYLYKDLDGDNTPDGNEKILELTTNLTGNSGFANIPITPTAVSGTFFVAALYQGNGSASTWIATDTNNPAGKSWVATSNANSFNPSSFSAFAATGNNWLLRANTPGASSQTITVQANQTRSQVNFGNQSTTNTSTPFIFVNDVLWTEGNSGSTNAAFTITLSNASSQVVTVNYATANNTASASDYTNTTGTLTFNPGEIEKILNVAVIGDTVSEADETFFLNLSNPTNAFLGDNQGVGIIISDDLPAISITDLLVVEGSNTNATLTVSLNAPYSQNVTVQYSTTPVTATAGSDYTAISGTLTFLVGETSKTLNLPILNDSINEADEIVNITLTSPTNAVLSKATGKVTISDTLQASTTTILAANVENLTLTGTAAINGTGNTGNNIITGNNANNILSGLDGNDHLRGAGGKDTLTGGLGSDKFNYINLADSLLNNFDVITAFNANAGNDLFLVGTARAGFSNGGVVATLDAAGIAAKLTNTNFGANFAAQFTFGTRTFVAINNAIAGFSATTDAIIEVTGLTGTLNINNFTTV